MVRAVGTASSTSRVSTCCFTLLCTSTRGDWPDTVTDSCNVPTVRSALMVATKFEGSSISRLMTLKPCRVNVSRYLPGRRSTMR